MGFLDGFFFGLGALMAYSLMVFIGTLIAYPERDSTDPPGSRSGLHLLIDHRTGCHYLMTRKGGLTPRLDTNGRQICEAGKEGQP